MTYRNYHLSLMPPWLQGTNGTQWAHGLAEHLDGLMETTKDAVTRRFPAYAAADGDDLALAYIGTERGLPRYPLETDVAYGARLIAAWERWQTAGAEVSLATELAGLGYTGVNIWTVLDDGAIDGNTTWWSRFWILITGHPYIVTAHTYGGGDSYGDDFVYGLDATVEEMFALKKAIRTWKPAHALCVYVNFLMAGATYYGQAGETYGGGSLYSSNFVIVAMGF